MNPVDLEFSDACLYRRMRHRTGETQNEQPQPGRAETGRVGQEAKTEDCRGPEQLEEAGKGNPLESLQGMWLRQQLAFKLLPSRTVK